MQTYDQNNITEGDKNVSFKVEGREDAQAYFSPVNTTSEIGIVLISEWWGLNKSITKTADIFAQKGFQVITPDLYRGKLGHNYEEAGHLFKSLAFDDAIKDILAAGEFLKTLGCKRLAITGFCMGGALTLAAISASQIFEASSPFYGIPDLNKCKLDNIKCPILAHFGETDDHAGFSDPEAARNLELKAKEAGLNFSLHMWDGAGHAFMNQDSLKNYRPEIAEKALEETSEFFKKHLVN